MPQGVKARVRACGACNEPALPVHACDLGLTPTPTLTPTPDPLQVGKANRTKKRLANRDIAIGRP